MSDIEFSPQNNPGGVCLLSLVPAFGVDFDPASATSGVLDSATVTFQNGYRWFGLYGTEGTKQFSEPGKVDDNGPYYEPTVRCFVPGDALQHRQQIADWLYHWPFLLLIEDNAGSKRIVGTVAQPMRLTQVQYDTTDSFGGRRGTLLTFTGQTYRPAVYLQ